MIPVKDTELAPYATNWQTRLATGYATFGLSSAQAALFTDVYTPWNDAWTALQAARSSGIRSENLTSDKDEAKVQLLLVMRELYAFVQNNRSVSTGNKDLLGVKNRSSERTPTAAPGPLSNFTAEINGNGSLTIRWKSDNPAGVHGTMYQVWRKIGTGDFVYAGGTGAKEFTDDTVPAGTSNICYQLQAVRSTAVGPWSQFNVNFSMGGGATVTESAPSKIAA